MKQPKPAKSKLTPKISEAIAKAVECGASWSAAAAVGISRRTLYSWRETGRKETKGPFRDLVDALERAEAKFICQQLETISRAGRVSWQACAWLLERRHPEKFARQDRWQVEQVRQLQAELAAIRAEMNKPQIRIAE